MKRRVAMIVGIVTAALVAVAAAVPVAAHMGMNVGFLTSGQSDGTTVSLAQAKTDFQQYLQRQGFNNLDVSEVMQFSNQFYAEAADSQSGNAAFEMVMTLDGSSVCPEPGPNMMWNTTYSSLFGDQGLGQRNGMPGYGANGGHAYGMMGGTYGHGMAGGYGLMSGSYGYGMMDDDDEGYGMMGYHPETGTQLDQPLTAETAQARVQSWLDQNRPGVTAADATAFPGYFTFHTERNGKITGMLSIQDSTGAIWEHVWHGTFVAMEPAE